MRKGLIILLVALFAFSFTSAAFAAAFDDLPPNHWAYASVQKLVKDGIVTGYDAKHYAGDKPVTRYEMAVIVGKAMENYSKATDANKGEILKLITEFSTELNTLGVRITNLEKKAKFELSGDLQFRDSIKPSDKLVTATSSADYRFRIYGVDHITDQTAISFRIGSEPKLGGKFFAYAPTTFTAFGTNGAQNGTVTANNNSNTVTSISLSQAYVTQQVGGITATLGEIPLKLDALNIIINSSAYSFDGLKFQGKSGVVNWTGNWGRFESNVDVASIDGTAADGKFTYGGGYARMWDSKNSDWATLKSTVYTDTSLENLKYTDLYQNTTFARYFYGDAKYDIDDKWVVGALAVHNGAATVAPGNKNAFYTYAQYGDKKLVKAGDANVNLSYYGSGLYGFNRFINPDYPNAISKQLNTDAVLDVLSFRSLCLTYNYAFNSTLSSYLTAEKVTDRSHANNGYGFTLYRIGMVANF